MSEEKQASHSPSEKEITALVTHYTCTRNCGGFKGMAAACCTVGHRDFIIGPIVDTKEFLTRLNATVAKEGRKYTYAEVFIDYKEGHKLFPDKPTWQTKEFYPALRVQMDEAQNHPCRFLSNSSECTVYDERPGVCRTLSVRPFKNDPQKSLRVVRVFVEARELKLPASVCHRIVDQLWQLQIW